MPVRSIGPIRITGTARAGKAVVLHRYPLLVEAPAQHGPGIRLEDCGALMEDVLLAYEDEPDPALVARDLGTTAHHVNQAVQYALDAGLAIKPRTPRKGV